MNAIRPDLPITPQPQAAGPSAAAKAAQAAFFRAALTGLEAAAPRPQAAQSAGEAEPRAARPGSLLDIRV